ncbi:collagen alpha-1(III) chain-like isoform X2 [Heterocephalus glaber]|uniref:Collagen alpha-1(III) chain-like isoform X2 n=1 Tax=Heterocephalus glaber TaxID=10181 RepID=A0AAX6T7C3_HETGA|nr:collagen alpha-1(III) chain-like isoform X2 [Heterocephalus glaber]
MSLPGSPKPAGSSQHPAPGALPKGRTTSPRPAAPDAFLTWRTPPRTRTLFRGRRAAQVPAALGRSPHALRTKPAMHLHYRLPLRGSGHNSRSLPGVLGVRNAGDKGRAAPGPCVGLRASPSALERGGLGSRAPDPPPRGDHGQRPPAPPRELLSGGGGQGAPRGAAVPALGARGLRPTCTPPSAPGPAGDWDPPLSGPGMGPPGRGSPGRAGAGRRKMALAHVLGKNKKKESSRFHTDTISHPAPFHRTTWSLQKHLNLKKKEKPKSSARAEQGSLLDAAFQLAAGTDTNTQQANQRTRRILTGSLGQLPSAP